MKSAILRYLSGLVFCMIIFVSGCKDDPEKDELKIEGMILGYPEGKIVLAKYQNGGIMKIDSVFMTKGKFKFSLPDPGLPEIYYIIADDDQLVIDFFSDKDDIEIFADYEKGFVRVKGSDIHNEYLEFLENSAIYENRQKDLFDQLQDALSNNDTASVNVLNSMRENVQREHIEFIRSYVNEHRSSYVSLYSASSVLCNIAEQDEIESLLDLFPDSLRSYVYYKDIEDRAKILKMTAPGMQAPDFTMQDSSGNFVSLASLQGNYVLLRFTGSWNFESYQESEMLKEIHRKNKDLVILQVGLERNKDEWKKFIDQTNTNWLFVSDLSGLLNEAAVIYGIKKIPFNFLLDKKGVILQRDISLNELSEFLEEI